MENWEWLHNKQTTLKLVFDSLVLQKGGGRGRKPQSDKDKDYFPDDKEKPYGCDSEYNFFYYIVWSLSSYLFIIVVRKISFLCEIHTLS